MGFLRTPTPLLSFCSQNSPNKKQLSIKSPHLPPPPPPPRTKRDPNKDLPRNSEIPKIDILFQLDLYESDSHGSAPKSFKQMLIDAKAVLFVVKNSQPTSLDVLTLYLSSAHAIPGKRIKNTYEQNIMNKVP